MADRNFGYKIFAVVVTIVLIFLAGNMLPSFFHRNQQPPISSPKQKTLPYTIASFSVTLHNSQNDPTKFTYDQIVVLNSSMFSKYEAPNLQNVVWSNINGTVIPSWIQSGDSSSSTSTVYWLRLSFNIAPYSNSEVYLNFANKTNNLFKSHEYEGVNPSATNPYGEYDNGQYVFPAYWDFKGTGTPSGLSAIQSGTASISFDNGANIYAPTGYYHAGFVTLHSYPSDYIWMANVSSYQILSGGPGIFPISISNTNQFSAQDNGEGFAGGFPYSVFGNSGDSRFYETGLNHGNIMNWNITMPNVSTYAMSWNGNEVVGYTPLMNPASFAHFSSFSENPKVYFSSYIETGGLGSARIQENWIAGFYPLPNDIMPSFSVNMNLTSPQL